MPKAVKKTKKVRKSVVEEVYSVEKIIKKKIGDEGKVIYYLKWYGYPESENTWEPEENLNCPELIQKFELSLLEGNATPTAEAGSSTVVKSPSKVLDQISMNCTVGSPNANGTDTKNALEKRKNAAKSNKTNPVKKFKGSSLAIDSGEDKKGGAGEPSADESRKRAEEEGPKYISGFAKKWEAEEILGATEEHGQILFLIKW